MKVGLELFTAAGPKIVSDLVKDGHRVFLDLKYHDIPNTVAGAVRSACELGARMMNVHALGGREMMRAAVEAADEFGESPESETEGQKRPLVIAVTVLTSMDARELGEVGSAFQFETIYDTMDPKRFSPGDVMPRLMKAISKYERGRAKEYLDAMDQDEGPESITALATPPAVHLALMAKNAGLDGVVCSPKEAAVIRKVCGEEFLIVTPGVRPRDADADDQKRVTTPAEAIAAGADFIVVGRPITAAPDPRAALETLFD